MRKFNEILTEAKKTYEFKVGLAGSMPEGFETSLKTALEKFDVVNMTAGKKTPIQERPLDFPQLQNMEVTYFEAEVNYPTTPQVLQEYLGKCCGVDQSYIIVRNMNDPREEYQSEAEETTYDVLLTQEDMGGESAQEEAGENRVMNLLKELETARKERGHEPTEGVHVGDSKDIDDKESSASTVGS